MKKCTVWLLCFMLLAGCSKQPEEIEAGMALRGKLLQAESCSFDAEITADYGDRIHTFRMHCITDSAGDISFTVIKPDSISGISGKLTGNGGKLTFDETALHFELMSEEDLSPISAPWILINTLRKGCITSVCKENDAIRLSLDDSFDNEHLHLDIWLDSENTPKQADILYDGKRILSLNVINFEIM